MARNPAKEALYFVVMIGIVSLFADITYEGSRSITGPFMAQLGASALTVSIVAGLGEFLGYTLRLVSGFVSERSGRLWPIILFGYIIQMISVPLLALAGSWQVAALLIIVERIGKATRNPPRNVLLSHAGKEIGFGWAFGLHGAMDQLGALSGPLSVAVVLAHHGAYRTAFAMLLIPALMTIALIITARFIYHRPHQAEVTPTDLNAKHLPRRFWIYMAGIVLIAAGSPDFSLLSYHFGKTTVVPATWIPIFYAAAMGASGFGSLFLGRLFDRKGVAILIPLTAVTALSVPLIFCGGFGAILAGCMLWGIGTGVQESLIPAAIATLVPTERRASAYGIFMAGYGTFWFLGSAAIGLLYGISLPMLIVFSFVLQLAAIPFFWVLKKAPH